MRATRGAGTMASLRTVGAGFVPAARTPVSGAAPSPARIARAEQDDGATLDLWGVPGRMGLLGGRRRKPEPVETARPVVGTASSSREQPTGRSDCTRAPVTRELVAVWQCPQCR